MPKGVAKKTAPRPGALQGPRTPGSIFSLFLALFDQLPKTRMLLELLFFAERQLRSVEKITDGIFVEHTVDENTFRTPLEIDPVIVRAVAVESLALALDGAERPGVKLIQVVRQESEIRQELELQLFWDLCHFRGADLIKDDLVHGVSFWAV